MPSDVARLDAGFERFELLRSMAGDMHEWGGLGYLIRKNAHILS